MPCSSGGAGEDCRTGAEERDPRFFLWQANRRLHSSAPLCERISPVLNGLQGLTLLRDIEVRVYDLEDEDNHQEFTCHSDDDCDDKGCYLCPRNLPPLPDGEQR